MKLAEKNDRFDCTEVIAEKRFNLCQIVKSVASSFLLRPILEDFIKSISFEMKCPFKKGEYVARKMPLKIPGFFPFPLGLYCFDFNFYGKTKSFKGMEKFMSMNVNAEMK